MQHHDPYISCFVIVITARPTEKGVAGDNSWGPCVVLELVIIIINVNND